MSALLRCLGFLLLLGLLTERPAAATHLVGGELTYRYLDAQGSAATPYRYTISARVYFNKEIGSLLPYGNPSITIQVYSNAVGQALVQNLTIPRKSVAEITPPTVPGCPLQVPRVTLGLYENDG